MSPAVSASAMRPEGWKLTSHLQRCVSTCRRRCRAGRGRRRSTARTPEAQQPAWRRPDLQGRGGVNGHRASQPQGGGGHNNSSSSSWKQLPHSAGLGRLEASSPHESTTATLSSSLVMCSVSVLRAPAVPALILVMLLEMSNICPGNAAFTRNPGKKFSLPPRNSLRDVTVSIRNEISHEKQDLMVCIFSSIQQTSHRLRVHENAALL